MISERPPPDPLALEKLLSYLASGRPVPLPWVIRYQASGGDPVAAAWAESSDPYDMLEVLRVAGKLDSRPLDEALVQEICAWPDGGLHRDPDGPEGASFVEARLAAAIRRTVPAPPTLDELRAVDPERFLCLHVSYSYSSMHELLEDLHARGLPRARWLVLSASGGWDPVVMAWRCASTLSRVILLAAVAPAVLACSLAALADKVASFRFWYQPRISRSERSLAMRECAARLRGAAAMLARDEYREACAEVAGVLAFAQGTGEVCSAVAFLAEESFAQPPEGVRLSLAGLLAARHRLVRLAPG